MTVHTRTPYEPPRIVKRDPILWTAVSELASSSPPA
jgi:hypothetical protein